MTCCKILFLCLRCSIVTLLLIESVEIILGFIVPVLKKWNLLKMQMCQNRKMSKCDLETCDSKAMCQYKSDDGSFEDQCTVYHLWFIEMFECLIENAILL